MATINNLYVFVSDEDKSFGVNVTEHTVEKGVDITDHVKRQAMTVSISGEIVGKNAADIRDKLVKMHQTGVVCKYVGRTTLSNCLITDFSTSYPYSVWGGCEFSATLKEIRTAKSASDQTDKAGTQQPEKNSKDEYIYHTVKKGDCVWALVAGSNAPYKKYGMSCNEVMKLNPGAFSRKGDFRTLQIGQKIIVGKR